MLSYLPHFRYPLYGLLLLVLGACTRPEVNPAYFLLEGEFEGEVHVRDFRWRYNAGELNQDTLTTFIRYTDPVSLSLEAMGAFDSGLEYGTFLLTDSTLQFLSTAGVCPADTNCHFPIGNFPQYPYAYRVTADSLVISVDLDYVAPMLGSHDTEKREVYKRFSLRRKQ